MRSWARWLCVGWSVVLLVACSAKDPVETAEGALDPSNRLVIEQTYQRGRTAYATERYDEAAAFFAKVVKADPEHLNARINWGVALSRGGRPMDAIPHFQFVVSRDPTNAQAYYNWGAALARLGRHDEALEKFDQALQLQSATAMGVSTAAERVLRSYLHRQRPEAQQTQIDPQRGAPSSPAPLPPIGVIPPLPAPAAPGQGPPTR